MGVPLMWYWRRALFTLSVLGYKNVNLDAYFCQKLQKSILLLHFPYYFDLKKNLILRKKVRFLPRRDSEAAGTAVCQSRTKSGQDYTSYFHNSTVSEWNYGNNSPLEVLNK